MNWEYIEAVFAEDIQFTCATRAEIFDALAHLEQEFGLGWIKTTKSSISSSGALGRMVAFAKCLKVADAMTDGSILKKKLHSDYLSEECQVAISETLTAERLLSSGATVRYEPQLPGTTKRPDLLANWGTQQIAFEVVLPSLSARDEAENRQMEAMLSQCTDLLTSGTLNVYLSDFSITPDLIDSVVAAVKLLSDDTTRGHERHISDGAYLAYDPDVHEVRVPAPNDASGEEYVYAFPVTDPAYHKVKAMLQIRTPMWFVSSVKSRRSGDRTLRTELVVRLHRPVTDPRALGKAEQECEQLPSGTAGVVVIDMSRTSVSLRPEQWARDIRDSFGPDLLPRISAIWLRSGQPVAGHEWREWLIANPHAAINLPSDVMNLLIPSATPVDLG